ncbi:hypothetical protein [Bradyrhizobium sp. dw_411]|uniref:hypothetical protein n=1 Tax=Bradyrhizobium sp. dw_411 TaxID=2720082 RepID=UPI001BCB6CC5|nr:hypothetical protein [Bradyrhizobium sp. dw_411]
MTTEVEDDEVILFEQRPNVFLYALEVTRIGYPLVAVALLASLSVIYFKGLHVNMVRLALLELFSYVLGNLCFFLVAISKACFLTVIATNRRAIVRFSGWGIATTDGVSIAIEAITRIETNSYGATYGSVYLESDQASRRKSSKNSKHTFSEQRAPPYISGEPSDVADPIKRTVSIWRSMPFAPRLYGFYGFKRFDEFARIVSERHKLRSMMVSEG